MANFYKSAVLLSLFFGPVTSLIGFRFDLPDQEEHCFYEAFDTESVPMTLEFTVLQGGQFDIDASVTDPDGVMFYNESRLSHDSVTFQPSNGTYEFCFSNEFSSYTHKIVQFIVRPSAISVRGLEAFRLMNTVPTLIESAMDQVRLACSDIAELQWEYRLREARSRYKAEELKMEVSYMAAMATICIVISGLGQVFFVKALFTDDRSKSKERPILRTITSADVITG
ncbi:hypothetical protein CAPTEDRAFT_99876 [Capitella teleta]|uniref:GOLD domain-containing protein n=1 Tax=Capitella teleta TaxID=283909 RepID=R7UR25_CAPTE|nr:hypothetical protein CAPTEDRAFT_99876 [Capitella teleta]|eukprot:ELU08615.1 hypothetical protein CAPTEDRAFT_99876 [Capitella teleta]